MTGFDKHKFTCPTPCDSGCEASCHQEHKHAVRREHQPEECLATIERRVEAGINNLPRGEELSEHAAVVAGAIVGAAKAFVDLPETLRLTGKDIAQHLLLMAESAAMVRSPLVEEYEEMISTGRLSSDTDNGSGCCTACGGSGYGADSYRCSDCLGTGHTHDGECPTVNK